MRRLLVVAAVVCMGVSGGTSAFAASVPSVAVLYFDNDTGDAENEYLGKGLADMMVTDLTAFPGIQVVEREKLEALLAELKLQRGKYFDPKTAQKIGKGVGAEYAVAGSFLSVAPDIRIDVRVIRINTGEIVRARKVTGPKDHFFELQQELAAALIEGLGAPLAAGDSGRIAAAQEANRVDDLGTARDYGRSLDLQDHGDLKSASELMQQVVEKAPRFALAKTRQMEILKSLYAAKDVRNKALSSSEQRLVTLVDERLDKLQHTAAADPIEVIAYRILRSDIFLRRVALSLDRPAKEYRADLAAYVQNEEKLLDTVLAFAKAHPSEYQIGISIDCLRCVEGETAKLMHELQIENPVTATDTNPQGMIEQFVDVLMFGVAPEGFEGPRIKLKSAVCLYKVDPAYAALSLAWLDRALEAIQYQAAHDSDRAGTWRDSRTIEIYQGQALVYLALGKTEDAVAKLQTILTRYPKSTKFPETEQAMRAVLSGTGTIDGKPIIPPCDDPK